MLLFKVHFTKGHNKGSTHRKGRRNASSLTDPLLGWSATFDEEGTRATHNIKLPESGNGRISVTNKPSRVNDLSVAIDHLVSRRAVVPMHMRSVLGKLQYADSHVWGRAGRLAMADLREIGHTGRSEVSLDDLQVKALEVLKERLCSGRPKTFIADDVQRPTLIFTDGALEYEGNDPVATIGGVLVGPDGICEVFGASVPDEVMRLWQSDGKVHVIGLVELYACVVSLLHWKPSVASRRVVMFVDNWPALDVLVKGTSLQAQTTPRISALSSKGNSFSSEYRNPNKVMSVFAQVNVDSFMSWKTNFMSWIGYGDDRYLKLMPTVEKMTKAPDISTYKEEDKELAHKFYAILSSYLHGRCSSLVRAESENRDGFKLWYDLMHEFHPQTKQHTLSLAQTLASYPSFSAKQSMLENILNYETLVDQYEKSSGERYPSDFAKM